MKKYFVNGQFDDHFMFEGSNDLIVATRCSSNSAGDRTYTYVSNFWEREPLSRGFGLKSINGMFYQARSGAIQLSDQFSR